MKHLLRNIIGLAAIVPLFWWTVVPNALQYCAPDGNKGYVEYSVIRQDNKGNDVKLQFNAVCQKGFCDTVTGTPAPTY